VIEALRLRIGAIWATDLGAFVPVKAKPVQPFENSVEGAGDITGLVGIFDAEDELSTLMTSEEPVEEGSSDIAHVGHTGRAGSVTDADSLIYGTHLDLFYTSVADAI
jgi:hypothetical protein